MNEDEFSATDQGHAVDSFIKYTMSLTMTYVGSEIGGVFTTSLGEIWALGGGEARHVAQAAREAGGH